MCDWKTPGNEAVVSQGDIDFSEQVLDTDKPLHINVSTFVAPVIRQTDDNLLHLPSSVQTPVNKDWGGKGTKSKDLGHHRTETITTVTSRINTRHLVSKIGKESKKPLKLLNIYYWENWSFP